MEFWSALIGAFVGGAFTFFGSWWQTKRVLAHDRELAAQAREDERATNQHALVASVARDLLEPVGRLEVWADRHERVSTRINSPDFNPPILQLNHLQHTHAPVLGPDFVENWRQLKEALRTFRKPQVIPPRDGEPTEGQWSSDQMQAAARKLREYDLVVQQQLLAVITDGTTPTRLPTPSLDV